MKLTVFLLFTILLNVSAEGISQKVTLSEKESTLESVFKKITSQTGYVFFYNDELLKETRKVSLDVKNVSLQAALEICFKDQPVGYFISGNKTIAVQKKIVLNFELEPDVLNNFLPIRGRVVDDKTGAPIVGASVMIKGTTVGTVVDNAGEFRMSADVGATLVISFVGYETREAKVTASGNMVVKLTQKLDDLQETVVTGVYNRKANSYTGSVITLSNEDLRKVGNANLFQTLKNISPSMVLDNFTMGSNPNTLPDIQLRGTSTFPADLAGTAGLKGNYQKRSTEPLFILDGFEATIERIFDLDINRIERVTILKDAASKAIYGAKAANGVIVIETKKLNAGSGALVSYNASLDVEIPDLTSYNLANSMEKLEAERIDGMYNSRSVDEAVQLQQLYNYRRKLALEGLDNDWIAKPLREGIGQKHTLAVELGGENLNVMADVSYRDVKGAMKGSERTNISGNLTASYRVKNFSFRNIMSANKNNEKESPYGTFSEYAQMNPYWRAINLDGSIPLFAEVGPTGLEYTNPLYNSLVKSKNITQYFNFTNNFYLEWNIIPGLRAVTRVGVDVKSSSADEFYPASHTKFATYVYDSDEMKKRRGSYQVNNGKSNLISGDFNINYTKEIDKHVYFANAGFNVSERKFDEIFHTAEGFSSDRMDNLIFGRAYALGSRPSGSEAINRDMGFLGAFSYMYDNRFLSDVTLRTSASSQFGADKRWAQFWSVGLGWNLHNESFMASMPFVEQFKIRGSAGSTGNPNFTSNASIATYNYYLQELYQGGPGSYLTNMANAGLQWETKMDYNIGFDAKVSKLNVRFDYYESFTKNLISDLSIANSTGFNSVKENIGEVKNSGFEVFATYLVWSKGRNFFSVNAGIETNKNKIIELSETMKSYNDRMDKLASDRGNSVPVKKYQDGMSMNAIWAVPSLGIDPSTGNEIYVKRDGNTTYAWNAADMVVVGNAYAPYQGIVGLSGEYNGFGVNVTARYLAGGQLYNQTLVDKVENVDMNYNVDKRVLTGRWLQPGQNALFKRLGTFTPEGGGPVEPEKTRATSRFVQDRNELTVAAVNVYYLLSNRTLANWGIQRLKLAFNMNEIATFSSIRLERGTSYPFARTMSFSLSTTF